MSFKSSALAVFADRRIAAMLWLGFASGLPLALTGGTLQAWLTVQGLDLKTIGFFTLVGLPYTFKFVWAPLLDRFEPRWREGLRRKAWLVVLQIALAAMCWWLAALDPTTQIDQLAVAAVLLAFLSASQDVVFDAYRNDVLDANQRGAGAAVSVFGYRMAMLVSGGLALVIADQWLGWPMMFRVVGGLFLLLALGSLLVPAVHASQQAPRTSAKAEWLGFLAMVLAGGLVWWLVKALPWPSLLGDFGTTRFGKLLVDTVAIGAAFVAAIVAARKVGFPSFTAPWDAFFSQRNAVALLALIVLYKLGDAFAGSLSTSFLIRGAGFTAAEVGTVNKVLGLIATIVGALAGGLWLAKRPLWGALMAFGVLQAVSNLGYWLIATNPKSYALMASAITLENLCGGLGTAAFVAFLMTLTDIRYSAAQFALLSALAAVGRVYVGPTAGVTVEAVGWPTFFLWTVVAALPGLLLLWWLRETIQSLSNKPAANTTAEAA
jgi:MFS transporter, PAT family, beta-lactamase induction signal transducer AmpG